MCSGLGVSILRYAGEVVVGVRADAAVMPDPLVRLFEAELRALVPEIAGGRCDGRVDRRRPAGEQHTISPARLPRWGEARTAGRNVQSRDSSTSLTAVQCPVPACRRESMTGASSWVAAFTAVLLAACDCGTDVPDPSCPPDVPVNAGLLSSPPTDIANVAGIIPLGNMNPRGNHVLPVDHMYIVYPATGHAPGTDSYPVYAMGPGRIYMIYRQQVDGRPDYDYQVYLDHTCSVTSRVDHLHGLSARIQDYLATTGAQWQDMFGSGTGPWILALGQPGGPAMLDVAAGAQLGTTKNYSGSWDVGVVDKRYMNGTIANMSRTRYPMIWDYVDQLPNLTIDTSVYGFVGNQYLNAACFIDYLSTSGGLQVAWFDLLLSSPKGCGQAGWDTPGYLRGAWFNPAIDGTPWPAFDIEVAALSIVPYNMNPDNVVQIGWGNAAAASSAANASLALLDPSQWDPPIMGKDQIGEGFHVPMDTATDATVNPDPARVGVATTVCYDLSYYGGTGYDYILFQLTDATHLKVKYVPGGYASSQCATLSGAFPAVDGTWATYVR